MTFRTMFESFLDLLYPPTCLSCGRLLDGGTRHICASCWSEVPLVRDHPVLVAEANSKIAQDVDAVVSAFVFQKTGPLQALVHALKYENADPVGVWLGERMADEVIGRLPPIDLIVPVPLHRSKERERGYNQAGMIANGVAKRVGSRVETGLLLRVRHTPTQTKLSIEQRRANVAEAFSVERSFERSLQGRTVMVVDDVITTGSTIAACARALRGAGVASVVAGSVALADHDA
ncbi:MAG: ComF family protein [Bacteroidetes bacterium]|nr:ComF family protein [Bacteroidota bacterium]